LLPDVRSEEKTDEQLYLGIDCPDFTKYLATYSDPMDDLRKLCTGQTLTSVTVRKAFALNVSTVNIWSYIGAVRDLFD
jgi:hypothetical protein